MTIIFGGLNVFMPITFIQIPNNLSLARKIYKNRNKIKDIIRKKITRNANLSLIQDWKYKDVGQKHGICLKNDSNKTLFMKNYQNKKLNPGYNKENKSQGI